MSLYGMSNAALLGELGQRLRSRRLQLNLSQQALADRAGVSRMTVTNFEHGRSVGVLTLIQLLRALDALDSLDAFVPDPGPSPLELAKMKGKERRRASRRRRADHGKDQS